jgi:hypothetical protein
MVWLNTNVPRLLLDESRFQRHGPCGGLITREILSCAMPAVLWSRDAVCVHPRLRTTTILVIMLTRGLGVRIATRVGEWISPGNCVSGHD